LKLWLDDVRPAPAGWLHIYTIEDAKGYLEAGIVEEASLDHDLGACESCLNGRTSEQWLNDHDWESMPNCTHFGTGYDLVCWMEATGYWPKSKPIVHSANPVGRAKMQAAINKRFELG